MLNGKNGRTRLESFAHAHNTVAAERQWLRGKCASAAAYVFIQIYLNQHEQSCEYVCVH